MKKVSALITSVGYLLASTAVFAALPARTVTIPSGTLPGPDPNALSLGGLIANALQIVFIAAGLAVLIYLIIGAFRWITSGGDKEAIGKARGTIVNALIGLAILALAFFITVLFGTIVGVNIFALPNIPTLSQSPTAFPTAEP